MLTSADVVQLDLGVPVGSEVGFRHAAIVVTAREVPDQQPSVIQVVPLTSNTRELRTEVTIAAATSGLDYESKAQCQHVRSVSAARVAARHGDVGPSTSVGSGRCWACCWTSLPSLAAQAGAKPEATRLGTSWLATAGEKRNP